MSNFRQLCTALAELFVMSICAMAFMFGCMLVVYMLLHWS